MGRHTTDECDGCHRFRELTYFDDQGWLCKNCKEDIDCFGYTIGDCEEGIAESYNTIDQLRSRIEELEKKNLDLFQLYLKRGEVIADEVDDLKSKLTIAQEALEEILTTATTLPDYPEDAKEIERKARQVLAKLEEMG